MEDCSKKELRLYCFVNTYICNIHAGIQSAHVLAELMYKYRELPALQLQPERTQRLNVTEWATKHKTIIVLNGGDCQNMGKLRGLLEHKDCPYPIAAFK